MSELLAVVRIAAPDRRRFAGAIALGTLAALATVGLLACSGALIDRSALRPPLSTLTVLMAAVQLLALARGPLRYAERLTSHDAALSALGRVRLWLFDRMAPRSPAALAAWASGDLLTRATGDVDALQDVYLRGIAPLTVAAVTSLATVAVCAAVLPAAGLVLAATLLGGTALACTSAWLRRRGPGDGEAALRGHLAAEIVELVSCAPDLVAFGRADAVLEQALAADAELTRRARRRSWTDGAVSALVMCCTGGAVVGLLAVVADAVAAGTLPGWSIAVLPLAALGAFEVVTPAADAAGRLADHVEAARRLWSIGDLPVPVVDRAAPLPLPPGSDVVLEDAVLRYRPDGPPALDGVDLAVPAGRRIAVVGPSGSGKSSLVNVMLRFWGLSSGSARLGGTDLDDLAQDDVRGRITWMAQDVHLFPTTIGANIAVGRRDASEDEVAAAVRAAQLGPFVDALPEGLTTPVGEHGARLSGGQRQRVALARALLARGDVLVLDEPTSGLDGPTAARLVRDVLAVTPGTSVVHVTHRHEEFGAFDEVVVIDGGRVRGGPSG